MTIPSDSPLKATARSRLTVSTSPTFSVVDITDRHAMRELSASVEPRDTGYAVMVTATGTGERTLFAFTNSQMKEPVAMSVNTPSTWHQSTPGADLIIIAHAAFMDSIAPLKIVRESQGWSVAVIDVEDIFDEFNHGHKSPWALRHFLHHASTAWHLPPRFVLLVGDASFDPRGYLDLDNVDFVPTRLVDTAFLETASDDWLVDFDDDGVPELAIGRLPVQSVEEATTVVSKLVSYAHTGRTGRWTREALVVADDTDIYDFAAASADVAAFLSPTLP